MNVSKGSAYLSDKPIKSIEDDILHRSSYAKDLAKAINNWGGDDSLIMSLNGFWGSGKSSLINMVEESLIMDEKYPQELIVRFNPWEWSKQEIIAEKLFETIENVLQKVTGNESKKEKKVVIKKFEYYKEILGIVGASAKSIKSSGSIIIDIILVIILFLGLAINTNWILIIGSIGVFLRLVISASTDLEQLFEKYILFNKKQIDDLEKTKSEISEILKEELDNCIIMIIDDIDRLSKREIQNLFQIVKANANFARIVYILLFDNDIVITALDEIAPEKGGKFLDKIIQVQLDLPAIDDSEVKEILKDELNKISLKISGKDIDHEISDWGKVFSKGIAPYFKTIRDVYRFVNSFSFHAHLFKKGSIYDINLVDLLCVEVLRLHESGVYKKLYTSKALLFPQYEDQLELYFEAGMIPDDKPKSFIQQFHETHAEIIQNKIATKVILGFLFPNHQEESSFAAMASDYVGYKDLLSENRLAHRLSFNNYFKFNTSLSGYTKTNFVELLNSDDDVLESLVNEEISKGRFKQLVERFESHIDSVDIEKNILLIQIIMLKIDRALNDDRLENEYRSTFTRFQSAIEVLLTVNLNRDKTLKLFSKLLNTNGALYVPVSLVSDFELKISEQSLSKKIKEVYEPVRDEIKSMAVNSIKKTARESYLANHLFYFQYLISKWQKWGDIDEVKEWIEELVSTRKGTIVFLKGMWNFSPDGKFHKIDEIEIYTNPQKVMETVQSMIENTESEYDLKVLESYINSYNSQVSSK